METAVGQARAAQLEAYLETDRRGVELLAVVQAEGQLVGLMVGEVPEERVAVEEVALGEG